MNEILTSLGRWDLDLHQVRAHMYGAPTPRERERWHALWLLAQDWSAAHVATALERDPHTIGAWLAAFRQHGPRPSPSSTRVDPPRPRPGDAS